MLQWLHIEYRLSFLEAPLGDGFNALIFPVELPRSDKGEVDRFFQMAHYWVD